MASVGFLVSVAITVCNLSKSVSIVGANFDMACMCYDNFLNFWISASSDEENFGWFLILKNSRNMFCR